MFQHYSYFFIWIYKISSWFHGRITGREAERMFLERGKPDCFLVRESVHRPGSYVLSVLTGDQVAHIMIHGKPNGMYDVGGGNQFSSLKELIDFYTHTPMVEKNGGLVSLKQVIWVTFLLYTSLYWL